jgi:hypothetical protein
MLNTYFKTASALCDSRQQVDWTRLLAPLQPHVEPHVCTQDRVLVTEPHDVDHPDHEPCSR